jgi:hypothetical protein
MSENYKGKLLKKTQVETQLKADKDKKRPAPGGEAKASLRTHALVGEFLDEREKKRPEREKFSIFLLEEKKRKRLHYNLDTIDLNRKLRIGLPKIRLS